MQKNLYHYYFEGIKEPITIEELDKYRARTRLSEILAEEPDYQGKEMISETMSTPVTGVSTITIKGKKYVWSVDKWKLLEDTKPKNQNTNESDLH